MEIKEVPKYWIEEELRFQKSKPKQLEQAEKRWSKVVGYHKVVQLRKELVRVVQEALNNYDK